MKSQCLYNQPVSQSASQPVSQSASQPVSQSASQPVSQSASQPVSQSASQPVSQSASQPVSQSASQHKFYRLWEVLNIGPDRSLQGLPGKFLVDDMPIKKAALKGAA
ncbi:hypothetical protein QVH37_10075 [Enterobacter pseudoroggenkampii]|uniref:hypothetical protein n=1 Tax=Enterobacter pseudoroggenkampii TaxID=2996112 RepID=UPI0025B14D98|nr:hypothetical protein [Enterobacter pseudoroggenkampii]WJW96590.1 hypothetical protein QVH37_10075 [Enterobacter pseudoroggenkampii]